MISRFTVKSKAFNINAGGYRKFFGDEKRFGICRLIFTFLTNNAAFTKRNPSLWYCRIL
jgi:hypothetical protein